ncbi:AAA family ATPase [Pseudomonas thivervalensis]|uniref:AAA domain-containing protein n=1 Tax=Pseudomonas thivervalensis TaxID=86265 RepID=A0A2Z4ZVH1_9PSED|nr:AAA family ATPase [Pseudomonas thivervalensis]AXA56682.1 hypothetical protein CE140_20685 [Pseudomonas thivervalensis]AXA62495.1 hypothetical protein CEQ51_21235 [Pseudomonas thivervalensis]
MKFEVGFREVMARSNVSLLLEEALRPVNWLFDGLVEDDRDNGHQWLITGEPKAGKSRFALQMAIAAAEGADFVGFRARRKNKVLYFNFELSRSVMGRRALEFFAGDETRMLQCDGNLIVVSEWSGVDVLDIKCAEYLEKLIMEVNPDIVIWDVMKRMTVAEENNNVEMSKVMRAIRDISSKRTHVVVHHSRKEVFARNAGARGIRGASAIHAEVDGVISIAKIGKRNTLQFSVRSVPDLEEIRLISNGIGFRRLTEEIKVEEKTIDLEVLFGDASHRSRKDMLLYFKDQMGRAESAADRKLKELVKAGVLVKEGSGREVLYRQGAKGC